MERHPGINVILATTATAMGLCSCAVKDGQLDFTWWQDAAAPVMEDDVIIESGGNGYYRSTPAPAHIPLASIPKENPEEKPEIQPEKQQPSAEQAVAQKQPVTQEPPPSAPVAKSATKPQTIPGVHVVQPGDTLSAIARRYGTTVSALVTANGMPSADVPLHINKQLRIPTATTQQTKPAPKTQPAAPAPAPASKPAVSSTATGTTYKVQAGDTLYRISRQYGVNPKALMQANGITPETANTIRVGTILRIPASN